MKDDRLLVALDANVLDETGAEHHLLLARVEALLARRGMAVFWPSGVKTEMLHPKAPAAIQAIAQAAVPDRPKRLSPRQEIDRIRVRAILRGDGRAGKHDADALHLSEAAEAGCRYFLTRDGKILRKRDTLRLALPSVLRILTPTEFTDLPETESMADAPKRDVP